MLIQYMNKGTILSNFVYNTQSVEISFRHILIVVSFFFSIYAPISSQEPHFRSYIEKYDLDFKRMEWGATWGWLERQINIAKDRQEDGLVMISYKPMRDTTNMNMMFVLSKIVSLPSYNKKNRCCIILKTDSESLINPIFSVTGYDDEENVIYRDSIIMKNGNINLDSISFELTREKAVKISIDYWGNSDPQQKLFLHEVIININEKDIGNNNIFDIDKQSRNRINKAIKKKRIVNLSEKDESFLPVINLVSDKKLIGLGECTHGSLSIKNSVYHFSKVFIEKDDVGAFIIERPADMILMYDLYVQGYNTSKEFIKELEENVRCYTDDYESFFDFLNWLQNYNRNHKEKIHFAGIDGIVAPQLSLYLYHIALLGEEASLPYLRFIKDKRYTDLIELAQSDPYFREKIDEKHFAYYKFVVESCTENSDMSTREFDMAKMTRKAVEILTDEKEKAIIHMHSSHLNVTPRINRTISNATGYYLKDWYGNGFFTVSFQIGEGEYTDERNIFDQELSTLLHPPMNQSFESVAAVTGHDYFFYPSAYIGEGIIFYNNIPRGGLTLEKDVFASVRKNYNSYIYIRYSIPLRDVESFPTFYMPRYLQNKTREIEKKYIDNYYTIKELTK